MDFRVKSSHVISCSLWKLAVIGGQAGFCALHLFSSAIEGFGAHAAVIPLDGAGWQQCCTGWAIRAKPHDYVPGKRKDRGENGMSGRTVKNRICEAAKNRLEKDN